LFTKVNKDCTENGIRFKKKRSRRRTRAFKCYGVEEGLEAKWEEPYTPC